MDVSSFPVGPRFRGAAYETAAAPLSCVAQIAGLGSSGPFLLGQGTSDLMRPRLLTVLATGALTLSLLGPTGAQADPAGVVPGPSLPEQASATAEEQAADALAEAQALFAKRSPAAARRLLADGGADATMALNQLIRTCATTCRPPSAGRPTRCSPARPTRAATPRGDGDTSSTRTVRRRRSAATPSASTTPRPPTPTPRRPPTATPPTASPTRSTRRWPPPSRSTTTYVDAGYRRPDRDGDLRRRRPRARHGRHLPRRHRTRRPLRLLHRRRRFDGACTARAYCVIDNDFADVPRATRRWRTSRSRWPTSTSTPSSTPTTPSRTPGSWRRRRPGPRTSSSTTSTTTGSTSTPASWRRPSSPLDRCDSGTATTTATGSSSATSPSAGPRRPARCPGSCCDVWELLSARRGARTSTPPRRCRPCSPGAAPASPPVYGQFADGQPRPGADLHEGVHAYPVAAAGQDVAPAAGEAQDRAGSSDPVRPPDQRPVALPPGAATGQRDWRLRLKVDMPARKTAPVARVAGAPRERHASRRPRSGSNRKGVGSTTVPFGFALARPVRRAGAGQRQPPDRC